MRQPVRLPRSLRHCPWPLLAVAAACSLAAVPVRAQEAPSAPAPVPAPAKSAAPEAGVQKVEVTGKTSDVEERRRSTAAKIVIGREEIDKFGDSSVGELLKRLPGVTMQGTPGRGGQIRMRGLGNGYTQILLDGERVQGGLSLDSIDPDQVERIEIIRAPTAETGARAIGGTINIITREGFTKRLNDLRASVGLENGQLQPQMSWSREDKWGELDYNIALSAFASDRADAGSVITTAPGERRVEDSDSREKRQGLHLTGKLQTKLEDGGSLMLMPLFIRSDYRTAKDTAFEADAVGPVDYTRSEASTRGAFTLARLNGQWRAPLGDGRLEVRGGAGEANNHSHTLRTEFAGPATTATTNTFYDDSVRSTERSLNLNAKHSLLLENGHSLVSGLELDAARRVEARTQLVNGSAVEDDFGDNLTAHSLRTAVYGQDEWTIDPHWSAYAGLRWEGINTSGQAEGQAATHNDSSVWTPLLHAVWKPEPKGADQIRMSLTRSYRSPTLSNLVGGTWRSKGVNSPTNPDRAGNADLKPELATGVDLAYERYLAGGGMLSLNLFQRQIQNLMRTVTAQVSQADGSTRYVASPQNIGNAMTRGLEAEAKLKLTEWWAEAPAVDLRVNASLFQSRVEQVPGPNNRLDQQPGGTANVGGDYKLPGTPVTIGGNFNWTPGYTTRLSDTQSIIVNRKRVIDAYVSWQVMPTVRLRLSASNLAPLHTDSISQVADETAETLGRSYVNWRLQLEMKL